jgi:hypothetical protein
LQISSFSLGVVGVFRRESDVGLGPEPPVCWEISQHTNEVERLGWNAFQRMKIQNYEFLRVFREKTIYFFPAIMGVPLYIKRTVFELKPV